MQNTYNTSTITKVFLQKCFYFLKTKQSNGEADKTNKTYKQIIVIAKALLNNYKEFTENLSEELFFLIIDKVVRNSVTDEIHRNILLNSPLLDAIATENEIDVLLKAIIPTLTKMGYGESASKILNHLCNEIYQVLSEYNDISKHIEIKNKLDRKNTLDSVDAKLYMTDENVRTLKRQVDSSLIKIKNTSKITKQRVERFSETIKDTEKRMYETNITILSIFSVVALTANSTIGFYTSAISALSNSSTYKLVFVLLIVGLICTNAFMILFYYLNKILDVKNCSLPSSNRFCAFLSKIAKPFSSLKPLLLSNTIILALIVILLCTWYNGCIEKRNEKIGSLHSFQTETTLSEELSSIIESSSETN